MSSTAGRAYNEQETLDYLLVSTCLFLAMLFWLHGQVPIRLWSRGSHSEYADLHR